MARCRCELNLYLFNLQFGICFLLWQLDGNPVGTLRVEVTDNGAGIALEDHDRVFSELVQFNSDELRGGGELISLGVSF